MNESEDEIIRKWALQISDWVAIRTNTVGLVGEDHETLVVYLYRMVQELDAQKPNVWMEHMKKASEREIEP